MNRLITRSQFKPIKSSTSDKPGSSAPPRLPRVPKQSTTIPPSSFTPIKIEEPKESSSSSSSSASSTASLSPPPSPRMGDNPPPPPPPPPAQRSLAGYNKPGATSVRSSISVSRDNDAPDYEIMIPFLGMISRDVHFEGKPHDNPCTHLADFIALCETFKNGNLDKNTLCLRAFPFSLRGPAKRWLNRKPPGYYTDWDKLAQDFVEEYFPPSRTTAYKDSISRFRQKEGMSLFDAWNEFQELLYSCPHHGFEQRHLAETFARGMNEESSKWVSSLAEGDITTLTLEAAMLHFADCASKSRNWERQTEGARRKLNIKEQVNAEIEKHLKKSTTPIKPPSASVFVADCQWCGACAHNGNQCQNFGRAEVWSSEEVDFVGQGFTNNQQGYTGYRQYRQQGNFQERPPYNSGVSQNQNSRPSGSFQE
ncbi:hypothetical protein LINPERHAP1_LOCUS24471 [Linum perenne]